MRRRLFPLQIVLLRARRSALPLLAIFTLAAQIAAPAHAANPGDVWQPLGPSGGTVTALAVDPADGNTVYAGSQEAGVFKSTNGGRTWQGVGLDGGVRRLAVAPGSRAVYAVTGFGLFRSTDGGASWVDLSPGLLAIAGTPFVDSLALSPAPGTVYAVVTLGRPTFNREILKSTDGGGSWRVIWMPPSGIVPFGVFTDPGDPGAVFAGTSNGVYSSADAGATWLAGDFQGDVVEVAAEHGPRRRLMASVTTGDIRFLRTYLYVSSDRGRTWRRRDGLAAQPLRLLLADPTTPGAFYAVTYFGELFRTTDAGLHWTSLGVLPRGGGEFPGSSLALALDPIRPGFGFVAVDGSRFGRSVWKTASFGAVWTPFFRGINAADFQAVTPDPAHPEILWAGAGAAGGSGSGTSPFGLWKSPDRGATWAQAAFPTSLVSAILFAGVSHSLFAVVNGALLRSEDGGLHWTPTGLDNVADLATPPEEPATLYALGRRGTVSGLNLSLDGGITWTTRETTAVTLAVAPGSPATLYANASGRVIGRDNGEALRRSTDRGATWTTLFRENGGFFSSIGLDPADPRRIVASFEHQDAIGRLFTDLLWTADGGATWRFGDLSPQPYRVFTLLPDPLVPHGFLAGTGEGAFASADGGATWTRLGEGLPRARTHLSLDPGSPSSLYAATEGGGIYRLERTVP